jgi:hypothetical protein
MDAGAMSMRRHGPSMRARAGSGGVFGRRRRGHGQLLRGRRVERAHTQTHTGVGFGRRCFLAYLLFTPGATAEARSRCEVEGRSRCDAKAGEVAARCQGKGREGWPRGRRGERPDDEKKTYRRSRAVRGGNYDNISSFLAVGFGYEQKWICPYPPPVAGLV